MKPKSEARSQKAEERTTASPVAAKRPTRTNIAELAPELGKLVEDMLVDGATFEDVVEAVEERGKEKVSLHAVQNFFRADLGIQQRRIQRQKETARALRKAMGDPKSGEQELADAILMTGLMRVNRRGAEFGAKDAVYDQYERKNLHLKQELAKQKKQKLQLEKRIVETRLKGEETRILMTKAKLGEMERMVEARKGKDQLGPEMLRMIQEIYGLIGDQNPAPAHV